MTLSLDFGVFALTIKEQLKQAGFKINRDALRRYQRDADEIMRLNVRGILTESAALTARKKLMKKMMGSIKRRKTNG